MAEGDSSDIRHRLNVLMKTVWELDRKIRLINPEVDAFERDSNNQELLRENLMNSFMRLFAFVYRTAAYSNHLDTI